MSKIKKTLKAIRAITKNPWLLNHVLSDNTVWSEYIRKNHGMDQNLPVIDITTLSPGFSETLDCFAFLDGGSLPTDIALLKTLSKRFDKCKYFEIGTWRGESVINLAETAEELYTLNLSREEIIEMGQSEKYADLHGFFSKANPKITHLTGNSLTYDFAGLNKKFDLIFIDGNHQYEFVKSDTRRVFESLVHDDTIVVWHDYAFSPENVRSEIFAGILDGIPEECKKNLYQVSNTLCAIYIKGDFPVDRIEYPSTPTKKFRLSIESEEI